MQFKKYKKESEYSYTLGAFPTIELLKARADKVIKVAVSKDYRDINGMSSLCAEKKIPFEINEKLIGRLSSKENCLVIGIYRKYNCRLDPCASHIALVNPGNMGNMGTIMRTMLGFGLKDLAVIGNGADIDDPKTVRASMGSVFRINHRKFVSAAEYISEYGERELYPFMLDGATELGKVKNCAGLYTLFFGNEASGLPPEYAKIGRSVVIRHSGEIDSLNLSVAAGIAIYEFSIGSATQGG